MKIYVFVAVKPKPADDEAQCLMITEKLDMINEWADECADNMEDINAIWGILECEIPYGDMKVMEAKFLRWSGIEALSCLAGMQSFLGTMDLSKVSAPK